ncbi:glycoside hydrolase family 19 protein [Delftia sp. DT-2]|uniref:glycoside hydrolase family 19 protein n=1 Tax=Delftia sp. DT-2 TaxID=3022772 RepID=UPI00233E5DDC|nr:glycoside hydrolase family 19 protein [Delftia sp. DT-2]MDC2859044.1 glycoside hydrolase family 19 protein [Delftia sp. DT-2]
MKLTPEIVSACTGATLLRATQWTSAITEACARYGIDSPARVAAFLAQVGHESGRLVYVREIWGPTAAQLRYEGRRDLGNTEAGDGKRFLGRGLIQVTGRNNYKAVTRALRAVTPQAPDFEQDPVALEQPAWAALSAAWFWHSRGLNALADRGDFLGITKKINGGTNGLDDRLALWAAAKKVLA